MKKIFKFVLTAIVSLCLSFSFSIPVFASKSGETDIINEMISYYSTYQSTAKTDIQRLVEKLKALNLTKGEEWEKIMEYWDYVNIDIKVISFICFRIISNHISARTSYKLIIKCKLFSKFILNLIYYFD